MATQQEIQAAQLVLQIIGPKIAEMHESLGKSCDVTVILTTPSNPGCGIFSTNSETIDQNYLIDRLRENKAKSAEGNH